MPDEKSYADVREQIRRQALVIYGTCSADELTVLCRLVFWVLTATTVRLSADVGSWGVTP